MPTSYLPFFIFILVLLLARVVSFFAVYARFRRLCLRYSHIAYCLLLLLLSNIMLALHVCVCVFSSHLYWTSGLLDGPAGVTQEKGHTSSLPSCLWSQRIFPSLPGSRLPIFYRDASSVLLQLVNQWLNFTYSRSHAFRYERKNTNPTLVRIELTTSVLADVQLTY